ncbi:AAA domain-containing protein [Chitinophaga rhizosphaerae]|uniref:AAA domain-containing protein n=1 Tax=Chitinophaga rhizosphaerae TaxID=1864947 RepID=UPI001F0C38DD|nr:AAA domain-containing protein [Chitinophaga rhizosphaerae]
MADGWPSGIDYLCGMDYFSRLRQLLQQEKSDDRENYRKLTESVSVAERRANGLSWYPVAIRGSEMSRGDYLTVEIERTTHHDVPHQLRFGASAVLFSQHDPKEYRAEGTIAWQSGNRLKITLKSDELPEWADSGKLGIDLLFDNTSYEEMFSALQKAESLLEKSTEGRLVRVLTGAETPAFDAYHPPFTSQTLNPSQQEAVNKILSANDVAVVHGPPGTGKTTTIVQAIKALLSNDDKKILVVAPSNAAVDLLSEKLFAEGLRVLRVGNPVKVSEKLTDITLDAQVSNHSSVKEIRRLRKQANEFRNMAHKYKRNFGKSEREQRKALFAEARNIMQSVEKMEQYIVSDILDKAQVVTATPVGAQHYTVRHLQYDTVVIDEAGQALEPACWIAALKGKKVVLAGDHCQLPPTIKSADAARDGLAETLLEKLAIRHPGSVTMLEEQYRMHNTIMGYASTAFYDSRLKAHPSVAGHLLFGEDAPLAFVDTAGCGFDEKQEGTSTSNPEEAAFLFRHLAGFVETLLPHYQPGNFPTIAVIAPYKEQIGLLREQLDHHPGLKIFGDRISVNTIDSFQGQERDVVYISITRSNSDNKIGFLSDIRRMNVAMTRARKKLVVIGDSATLSRLPYYAGFIAYAEANDAYKSAWEYMV